MSGVAIVQALLSGNAPLLAQVPAARILTGVIPQGTALPALSVQEVGSVDRNTVAMNEATRLVTDRVQVTVQAKSYAEQKLILGLVRSACPVHPGTVNGIVVDSVLPDTRGPDLEDTAAGIYGQTQDLIVKFIR